MNVGCWSTELFCCTPFACITPISTLWELGILLPCVWRLAAGFPFDCSNLINKKQPQLWWSCYEVTKQHSMYCFKHNPCLGKKNTCWINEISLEWSDCLNDKHFRIFSSESCKTYCLMHNFTETVNQIKVDKCMFQGINWYVLVFVTQYYHHAMCLPLHLYRKRDKLEIIGQYTLHPLISILTK